MTSPETRRRGEALAREVIASRDVRAMRLFAILATGADGKRLQEAIDRLS